MFNPTKFLAGAPLCPNGGFSQLMPIIAPVTILVACLGALHASWLRSSQREMTAVAELERMGASIHWAWRLDEQIVEKRVPASPPPSWFVPGDSFVVGVHLLFCRDPQLNEKLKCLETLRGLRCLAVTNARVSQAALRHLAGLTRLEWLDLHDTPLDDDAIRQLPALARLERLNLQNTRITDASLPHLAQFSRLKWLNLGGTGVTPGGLAYLRTRLPNAVVVFDIVPSPAVGGQKDWSSWLSNAKRSPDAMFARMTLRGRAIAPN